MMPSQQRSHEGRRKTKAGANSPSSCQEWLLLPVTTLATKECSDKTVFSRVDALEERNTRLGGVWFSESVLYPLGENNPCRTLNTFSIHRTRNEF